MGYEIVRKFSINRKELKVKYTVASSNVRDWNDRLVFEDVERNFKSIDELRDFLVGIANDVLGGMIKMPRSHAFSKRLIYLDSIGALTPDESYPEWKSIKNPTDEVKLILSGEQRYSLQEYIISGNSGLGQVGVKVSSASYGLREKRQATKFYSVETAEQVLERVSKVSNWVSSYNLKVIQCK